MAEKYELIVIGSGPGGYVAAIRAAQLGFKTAVVEKDRVGGRCLNYACIPAKAVLRAADVATEAREGASFGVEVGEVSINFAGVTGHRDKVVKTLTGGVAMLLKKNKVDVIEGFGALTDDANVRIGGQFDGTTIEADNVVLATGSVPKPVLGLQFGKRILSTETMWGLDELPAKLAVIGAGASGTEVASAFGRLGSAVHLFEALPQILPLEDKDIARAAAREIGKQGVTIVTDANIESVDADADGVTISWGDSKEKFDYLCIAAGRGPDVEGLGLDEAGVKLDDRGLIAVDDALRTNVKGVYAIGDMVRGKALAHKASDEGIIAVEDAKGLETHPIDHPFVPAATFCHPQVASFGLTEAQAKEQGYDVTVGRIPITAVGAPTVYGDRGGMV
ncbi:MAG: dihydrolipoamide dehydrogenase, partial [Thermoleophilaceae bacterium]|nr:dihydrolipoamide dehydrogenase [Thermoleophilaceae bacterium]